MQYKNYIQIKIHIYLHNCFIMHIFVVNYTFNLPIQNDKRRTFGKAQRKAWKNQS